MRLLLWLAVSFPLTVAPGDRLSWGQTLSVEHLAPNERVLIVLSSADGRPGEHLERVYQVDGGKTKWFAVSDLRGAPTPEGWYGYGKQKVVGAAALNDSEVFGLDCYLILLRRRFNLEGVDHGSRVIVGYYRDGRQIGEARFADDGGPLPDQIFGKEVPLSNRNLMCPPGFPMEVYAAIITPRAIELEMQQRKAGHRPDR